MKYIHKLLIFIAVVYHPVFGQQINYQERIDSLKIVKKQFETKIQQIDLEIDLLHQKMVFKSIKNPNNFNLTITLYQDAKVRENTWALGNYKVIPKGSKVTLLEFTDGYWKINYGQEVGYINDMYVWDTKEVKQIKEEIEVNKKLAQIEKNKQDEIEAEKRRSEIEKQKAEEETKEKLEEEKEQKRIEKARALGSPIYFISAIVSFNAIGKPEATISLKNISNNTIDAYDINVYCYNRYGNPVNHYAYDTNKFSGISQETIKPDETTYGTWTLYGHDNTAKIKVILEKVHFTNGKTWYPKGKSILIEGVSNQ